MATRAATVQITMPQMGESVTEGTVLEWLKQVGDRVEADEPLVEISTDKVDAEVPSPAAGTLVKILAEPDSTVQVGAVLGEIDTNGEAPAATEPDEPAAQEPAATEEPAQPAAAEEPEPEPAAEGELVDVAFPEMGDSVAEGTVLEWRVAPGDTVAVDDPLVEISTDKVDAELPSPVAGTVKEILVEADADRERRLDPVPDRRGRRGAGGRHERPGPACGRAGRARRACDNRRKRRQCHAGGEPDRERPRRRRRLDSGHRPAWAGNEGGRARGGRGQRRARSAAARTGRW